MLKRFAGAVADLLLCLLIGALACLLVPIFFFLLCSTED